MSVHVWTPPADVLAAGERASVRYGAPWPVAEGVQVAPSPAVAALARVLLRGLRGVPETGMRRPSDRLSAARYDPHRCGFAIDVMLSNDGDRVARGEAIANALVLHAEELGIQYVLWSRREWSSSSHGSRWERYTGDNPHVDHVHVEVGLDARGWSAEEMERRATAALFPPGTTLLPWLLVAAAAAAAVGVTRWS